MKKMTKVLALVLALAVGIYLLIRYQRKQG